ncbi:MAG: hypothetical protein ACP5NQ_09835 [Vulcanisaeta sp.]
MMLSFSPCTDPETFSAELNTAITYLRGLPVKSAVSEVLFILLPTDTGTSRFTASIIRHYLETRRGDLLARTGLGEGTVVNVEVIELRGLVRVLSGLVVV